MGVGGIGNPQDVSGASQSNKAGQDQAKLIDSVADQIQSQITDTKEEVAQFASSKVTVKSGNQKSQANGKDGVQDPTAAAEEFAASEAAKDEEDKKVKKKKKERDQLLKQLKMLSGMEAMLDAPGLTDEEKEQIETFLKKQEQLRQKEGERQFLEDKLQRLKDMVRKYMGKKK